MTEFWQENLTLAPADITSLRMPEVFVNHKDCFLNLQCKFSQFLLSSCQDFVHNYPCSSLLCMRPWEFSKYLAKEMQISTLLWKDKQQELGSSKQFLVQLLSKQWSCCFCWQLKQSQKQSHLSRQRAVVSLLVVSHHSTELKSSFKKKKAKPYCLAAAGCWISLQALKFRCWASCCDHMLLWNLHCFLRGKSFFLSLTFWSNRINLASSYSLVCLLV